MAAEDILQHLRGTISLTPERFGASVRGAALEVYLPEGPPLGLIHAAIHGDESDTTIVLSTALRTIRQLRWAVVLCVNPDGAALGTRGNARGVDLNRNFRTANWSPTPLRYPLETGGPKIYELRTGTAPESEPETAALRALVERVRPPIVVALHSDLACIEDPGATDLGERLSERTGLPRVADVGYPTPGSFGTWCSENGLPVITYELESAGLVALRKRHAPVLIDLLEGLLEERR